MGTLLIIGAIVTSAVSRLLADEFKSWNTWGVKKLIDLAVRRLPIDLRQRFGEEWSSYISEIPGEIAKLVAAIGLQVASWKMRDGLPPVARMEWQPVQPRGPRHFLLSALKRMFEAHSVVATICAFATLASAPVAIGLFFVMLLGPLISHTDIETETLVYGLDFLRALGVCILFLSIYLVRYYLRTRHRSPHGIPTYR